LVVVVKFHNVRVYEIKSYPLSSFNNQGPLMAISAVFAKEKFEEKRETARITYFGLPKLPRRPSMIAEADDPIAEPLVEAEVAEEEVTETQVVTSMETSVVSNQVCRLDRGRKFEYTPRNLIELGRRYYEITSQITTNIIESSDFNMYYIPVTPRHWSSNLYAGWSGHMIYRIMAWTNEPLIVRYFSSLGDNFGLNATWYGQPNVAVSSTKPTDLNTSTTIRTTGVLNDIPTEVGMMTFNSGSGQSFQMIDVHVPFNTHLNFLPTLNAQKTIADSSSHGVLTFTTNNQNATDYIRVFEKYGDDLRLHCFVPTFGSISPYQGVAPPTGSVVAGFYF